jgi:mannose-6-phosphate isomerase-like protein (cupin superfamily)
VSGGARTTTTQEQTMTTPYTLKRLTDVEDSAPKFGMSEVAEARFCTGDLDAEDTGVGFHRLKSGMRQPFGHKHDDAEEVYVVIAGSGRVKLDGDIVDLGKHDALRVAPGVTRGFEAGPDGMDMLVFGARHEGDGEVIPGWWAD